jgi:hypothetical protein
MHAKLAVRVGIAALAALVAACSPEKECRDGVQDMKRRIESFVGVNQPDDVQKTIELVNSAETQLATGNFEGCRESLSEARALLNRSQRTNQ